MSKDPFYGKAYGISPLGGNASESGSIKGVPLFYDPRVDTFISEQAIEELDDRDLSLINAEDYNREEEFRIKAGFRRL